MSGLYIEASRDGWTNGVQLSINDENGGYRLSGPKFNSSSQPIAKAVLGQRDRDEIRRYLNKFDAISEPILTETIDFLMAELNAAKGYMMNARIDLETGTKAAGIVTITGGIKRIDAAIAKATGQ